MIVADGPLNSSVAAPPASVSKCTQKAPHSQYRSCSQNGLQKRLTAGRVGVRRRKLWWRALAALRPTGLARVLPHFLRHPRLDVG
jgi:hypothetical protein